MSTSLQSQQQSDFEFRGRPRKRRDFFGTIKRRLGKSRNRSKSAGPENDIGRDDSLNRSVSADRGRNHDDRKLFCVVFILIVKCLSFYTNPNWSGLKFPRCVFF